MGPVSDSTCDTWREALAMQLFADLSPSERAGLAAHLDGCADCRDVARELADTFSMLAYVDPTNVTPTASVPPELTERVLGDLLDGGRLHRRRRTRVTLASAVGLLAAAAVLIAVFSAGPSAPTERTLALRGPSAVVATAVLSARSWGTSVQLHERGLPGNGVYTVSMETASGDWWVAGTYRAVSGREVDATMSCAVKLSQITGLRVVDSSGNVVLASYNA